jgi:hypothetical protein
LSKPDFYCPIVRGESKPLNVTMAAHRDLPKSESACTTIVMAREADISNLGESKQ